MRTGCLWVLIAITALGGSLTAQDRLEEQEPAHKDALFMRVVVRHQQGDFEGVIQATGDALVADSLNPFLYAFRGNASYHKSQYHQAVLDLERALYLLNDFPMAYYNLGLAYQALGDTDLASRNLQMACALNQEFCKPLEAGLNTRHILKTKPEPDAFACRCCAMYNQQNQHREDLVSQTLARRKQKQLSSSGQLKVYHDFQFTDRLLESGIRFIHRIADDSGKNWIPVHYDHGNGLAVADVDGDGLTDLYFMSQMGRNELWRNKGDGSFEDITVKSGLAVADRVSVTASFADMDNDGDPDMYLTTVKMGNLFFENRGDGTFKEVTARSGLAHRGHSSGVVLFDFNRDGLLDVFLTNVGVYTQDKRAGRAYWPGLVDAFAGHLKPERKEKSLLFENTGSLVFRDVTHKLGLNETGFSGDASFCDLNSDGYPELYVLNMQGDDHYYENRAGTSFVDQTATHFPKTPWGSMGIAFFDYDNDGLMDLYLTDMHSDMSEKILPRREKKKARMVWSDQFLEGGANNLFGNAFYRNKGRGPFSEASDTMGLENYWPWGLSVGDLNADGYQDLFVTSSMNYPFRYGLNALFLNNEAKSFVDSAFLLGVEPRAQTVKPWFSLDCTQADRAHPLCIGRNKAVAVWGALGSRSSAIFDYDDDGDLDIITNEFNAQPMVLTSDLAQRKQLSYLKIKLVGSKSNRNGLGAMVRIKLGTKTLSRYHDGKSGYLSQSDLPLYVGLGRASSIDSVEVLWPSGTRQIITKELKVNRTLVVVEPN